MYKVRKFQPNDIFSVIKIASETLPEKYSPSIFNYFYETYPQGFIVAEINHKIVGFIIGAKVFSDTNAKILMLSVLKEFRKQNVGSELLNNFIIQVSKEKIESIDLEVRTDNLSAIEFYKKHGFKISDTLKGFYQNKEDAYKMNKRI